MLGLQATWASLGLWRCMSLRDSCSWFIVWCDGSPGIVKRLQWGCTRQSPLVGQEMVLGLHCCESPLLDFNSIHIGFTCTDAEPSIISFVSWALVWALLHRPLLSWHVQLRAVHAAAPKL